VSLLRFFCEWCFERVEILGRAKSTYAEVLHHFMECPRRPPNASDEKVAGLATHITGIIENSDGDESAGEQKSGNVA
jgi:hypothetical protein